MERIIVIFGECSYLIIIVVGLFNELVLFLLLKLGDQVMLVINEILVLFYLDKVCGVFEWVGVNVDSVIFFDGEQYKSLMVLDMVFMVLLKKLYGCDIILVVFGGGVIGDFIGFVVVSYQ